MSIRKVTSETTTVTVNGKTYTNPEEMPPDVRRAYDEAMQALFVDRDQNGIPDILENHGDDNAKVTLGPISKSVIIEDRVTELNELPPEVREALASKCNDARSGSRNPWLYIGIAIGVTATLLLTCLLLK